MQPSDADHRAPRPRPGTAWHGLECADPRQPYGHWLDRLPPTLISAREGAILGGIAARQPIRDAHVRQRQSQPLLLSPALLGVTGRRLARSVCICMGATP
jgi:hypothetical protein